MTPRRITFLELDTPFPPVEHAIEEGLLAVGGELSPSRLSDAYYHGIFPWYNPNEPILWWSPDPRMVLACKHFKVSRSLAKKCRQVARQEQDENAEVRVLCDQHFIHIMANCANTRAEGTWINSDMVRGYYALHRAGLAHCVEVWRADTLIGGLYGVGIGQFFMGESMFFYESDASKIALYYLVQFLQQHGVQYIDCQQETDHLASLGAQPMARAEFMQLLHAARDLNAPPWQAGQLLATGELRPLAHS